MDTDKFNCMEYIDEMEVIDSNVMDKVLEGVKSYNYWQYTGREVERALLKDRLTINDFAAILSPAALPYLEDAARRASLETKKSLATPFPSLPPYTLPITVTTIASTAAFTVKIKLKEQGFLWRKLKKNYKKLP